LTLCAQLNLLAIGYYLCLKYKLKFTFARIKASIIDEKTI